MPVCKHTFGALNDLFGCSVAVRHVMSCESSLQKRKFIKAAHGEDVPVLFDNVTVFSGSEGINDVTGKMTPIPEADLLVTGSDCANLSNQRTDKTSYVGCFKDEELQSNTNGSAPNKRARKKSRPAECQSAITYKLGLLVFKICDEYIHTPLHTDKHTHIHTHIHTYVHVKLGHCHWRPFDFS